MRIVIDMQGAQTESCYRGIGRYTLAFAKAVIRNRGQHEVILALSGLFPSTIEPLRAEFEELLPPENIQVWCAPSPVRDNSPDNHARREVAELIREAFLASLNPDVIHISSLFEGYVDDAVTSIGKSSFKLPTSCVLYDLIPLLNAERYLKPDPNYSAFYSRKLESLKKADLLFAISEFSRQEGVEHLGLGQDEHKIVSVSTGVGPEFQPICIDDTTAHALYKKFGITRPFVLYTGGADERKNLPRLIQAYASLSKELRENHHLVLAGRLPEGNVIQLKSVAKKYGLGVDELLFTGYIEDNELLKFYNLCKLYVFPSWHEGFGLPALEAMACGTAVIGANTSSLPEVIGDNEALFDPLDVKAITEKITRALSDNEFYDFLCSRARLQARSFSWDATAIRAIREWESLPSRDLLEIETWRTTASRLGSLHKNLIQEVSEAAKVRLSDQNLREIALCIEKNERELALILRRRTLPESISWRIEGPFDSTYSLALVNRQIARSLSAQGHHVLLHSTEGTGDFPPSSQFLQKNPDLEEMHQRAAHSDQADADIVSRNLYPPRVEDMHAQFNFLHAYAWEESGFPREWAENFNCSLQGMTVVSEHVRKIMIDHGVTVPIEVSGNGVDHWSEVEPAKNLQINARSYRFLHVSSCFPRKGADVMLRAYGSAFRASDDVSLVIKTFPNPHNKIREWLNQAEGGDPNFPHVVILEKDYTDAELKALYEQCNALVAPSRAEGFGLPMAEAMLSGLAVITTGWSGQTDFCTSETAWLVDYRLARAQTHFQIYASAWAEPNEAHLAEVMREVFETPAEACAEKIAAGQRLLTNKFKWSDAAHRMVNAARQWSHPKARSKPRIGWVTTWNARCGIATYSEQLIRNMLDEVAVLAAHTNIRTADDEPNVRRCWSANDEDPLVNLRDIIDNEKLDTIVVQFNYGFFDLSALANFLEYQIDAGRTVIVVMHSTVDPVHAPNKKLRILQHALNRCDRILVHSPGDMNRLKEQRISANVTLFPHGILDYVPSARPDVKERREFVIASYGFFLPHKGLLELITAISLIKQKKRRIRLDMVNAEYPSPLSIAMIKEANEKIDRLDLRKTVSLCTDFLDDQECLRRLSSADLIVFPYQETGESSSAAVRYGLAAGRPVAVTPIEIFEDVQRVVHTLPGQTSEALATGIIELMDAIQAESSSVLQTEEAATHWRNEHRYSNIGRRMSDMLIALSTLRETRPPANQEPFI